MKVTVEFVICDDKGNILSQNPLSPRSIGTQSLYDIEGRVEQMKNKALSEIEVSLLTLAQKEFTEEAKKTKNELVNPVEFYTVLYQIPKRLTYSICSP